MNYAPVAPKQYSIFRLASNRAHQYGLLVAADSATDLGGSNSKRRNSAPITIAGAFFMPALSCYGGLRRSTLGCVGFLLPRSANPVQLATLSCLAADRGGSSAKGSPPMTSLIPSAIRIFAYRRMALIALRADSSLFLRLNRYNNQITIARNLEKSGGRQ